VFFEGAGLVTLQAPVQLRTSATEFIFLLAELTVPLENRTFPKAQCGLQWQEDFFFLTSFSPTQPFQCTEGYFFSSAENFLHFNSTKTRISSFPTETQFC